MKRKRGRMIKVDNRLLYTIIALAILITIAVGVYAYGTNSPQTFGHSLSEISPPTGCASGQIVSWNGTNLVCLTQSFCPSGTTLYYNYTNGNEDTYGSQQSGGSSGGTDTCDGVNNEGGGAWYVCPVDASKTCRDYVYGGGFYYYKDIVCRKNLMLGCKE